MDRRAADDPLGRSSSSEGLALAGRLLDIDLLSLGWPIFVLAPGIVLFAAGSRSGARPVSGWRSRAASSRWSASC